MVLQILLLSNPPKQKSKRDSMSAFHAVKMLASSLIDHVRYRQASMKTTSKNNISLTKQRAVKTSSVRSPGGLMGFVGGT